MGEKKNPNCLKKDPGSAVGNKEREHRGVMGGELHSVPSKCWLQTVCVTFPSACALNFWGLLRLVVQEVGSNEVTRSCVQVLCCGWLGHGTAATRGCQACLRHLPGVNVLVVQC